MEAVPPQPALAASLTVNVEGHVRLQIPASPEAQAIFDLLTPEMKQNPGKHAAIAEEGKKADQFGADMISRWLPRTMFKANIGETGYSFAVIEGKLFYVILLPIRT